MYEMNAGYRQAFRVCQVTDPWEGSNQFQSVPVSAGAGTAQSRSFPLQCPLSVLGTSVVRSWPKVTSLAPLRLARSLRRAPPSRGHGAPRAGDMALPEPETWRSPSRGHGAPRAGDMALPEPGTWRSPSRGTWRSPSRGHGAPRAGDIGPRLGGEVALVSLRQGA